MSIIHIPQELQPKSQLACALCRVKLHLGKATAGLLDAQNRQAFACVSHFMEVELLIVGWADFIAVERLRYREQNPADALYGGLGNAWTDR